MREKLETLPLATLRDMAKAQGLKGVSGFRKSELIDLLCREAEKLEQEKAAVSEEPAAAPAPEESVSQDKPAVQAERTERSENTGNRTVAYGSRYRDGRQQDRF